MNPNKKRYSSNDVNRMLLKMQAMRQRIKELEEELSTTENLLDARVKVLSLIPECEVHGFCLPHFSEWIKKKIRIENVEMSRATNKDLIWEFQREEREKEWGKMIFGKWGPIDTDKSNE